MPPNESDLALEALRRRLFDEDRGCVLVTDKGVRVSNVREDSIILAGARKEFVSFEVWGSDRIYYVPAGLFWTEALPV